MTHNREQSRAPPMVPNQTKNGAKPGGALHYAEYPFVISAAGNGLDCHRTWELLYLGSIVVTKTSPLDRLFDGLPVVIVEDWNEVGDKGNLAKWLQQYGRLTDRTAVWRRLEPGTLVNSIREVLLKSSHGARVDP